MAIGPQQHFQTISLEGRVALHLPVARLEILQAELVRFLAPAHDKVLSLQNHRSMPEGIQLVAVAAVPHVAAVTRQEAIQLALVQQLSQRGRLPQEDVLDRLMEWQHRVGHPRHFLQQQAHPRREVHVQELAP